MHRLRAVGIAVLVVGAALSGLAGSGSATPEAGAAAAPSADFDRVQFRIAVRADGSARWTFHYERTLSNATERERFEAFAADFSENETLLYRDFRNQSASLVSLGREATGREMAATDVSRRAFVATGLNEVGVVELSFSWVGFATVEGSRVVVGDVFEGGLYLGPDQSLVVRAGPDLVFRSVAPDGAFSGESPAESDTVTWRGERTFVDNHPRAVFERAAPGATRETTTGPPETTARLAGSGTASTPTNATAPPSAGPSSTTLALAAALVVGVGAATLWWRRGGPGEVIHPGSDDGDAGMTGTALMDDEALVESLLRENGGRMRQSAIVDGTGWSKSKVSMVLSEMEEEGRVSKLRVGRENIVSLPGHEPDAARSPHDR